MAGKRKQDYLDKLVDEGKVKIRPYNTETKTIVTATIDFEKLLKRLKHNLTPIFLNHTKVTQKYFDMFYDEDDEETIHDIRKIIAEDLDHMLRFALMSLYDRLRVVALNHSVSMLDDDKYVYRSDNMEFPTYISSLMQSFGPLRLTDPVNLTLTYLPLQGTTKNLNLQGRNFLNPLYLRYERLLDVVKALKIPTCRISKSTSGSLWTTCRLQKDGDLTNVVGTVNPSYYDNEDVVRALLLSADPKQDQFLVDETTRHFSPTCYIARNLTEYDVKTLLFQKFLPLV